MIDLPTTIKYDMQPYTYGATLGNLHWHDQEYVDYNNGRRKATRRVLLGEIIAGSVTSRLFQYSSTRNAAGDLVTIYGVTPDEIARGHIVRVAM